MAGEGPGMGFKIPGGKNRNHKAREEAQKSTLAMALAEGFHRAEGRSPLGSPFPLGGSNNGERERRRGQHLFSSLSLFCLSMRGGGGVIPKGTGQAEKQHKFLTWLPNRPRLQPIDPARSHPRREKRGEKGGEKRDSRDETGQLKADRAPKFFHVVDPPFDSLTYQLVGREFACPGDNG